MRLARRFSRDRGRQTVAELRGVAHNDQPPSPVSEPGKAPHSNRRDAVEVEERLRAAERETRPLDEGAVRTECVRGVTSPPVVARAQTDRDVAAHRAVFGLVAGIGRDVTADAEVVVVGVAVVDVAVLHSQANCRSRPKLLGADPAADLDAHIGAGDVIEPHTVQAANLHVLDRLGLNGKIGCLRPSYRNETRCGAKEKAFHHLHLEPPKNCFLRGFRIRPVRSTEGTSPCSPPTRKTRYDQPRHRGMPPSVAIRTLMNGPSKQ